MRTRPLLRPGERLDSDRVTAILNHMHTARLARLAYESSGISNSTKLAHAAGVCPETARRFLGLNPERAVKDPRTSTTRKLMGALGYKLALVQNGAAR